MPIVKLNSEPIEPINPIERNDAVKTSLTNSHLQCIKNNETKNIETREIKGNIIYGGESARYTIVTDCPNDILHFGFSLISEFGFVHTSHIENITKNEVNIIVNNLSDKDIEFSINYIALHK